MPAALLFGEKHLLIWDAGEAGELTDGAALMPAVGDDLVLLFGGALEELGDAGEGVLLLEVGEEAGLGDAQRARRITDDLIRGYAIRRFLLGERWDCVDEGGFGLHGLGEDEVEDTEEEGAGLNGLRFEAVLIDGAVMVVLDVVVVGVSGRQSAHG